VRTARRLARRLSVLSAELLSSGFTFARNPARIAAEARLDGFYVIRTPYRRNKHHRLRNPGASLVFLAGGRIVGDYLRRVAVVAMQLAQILLPVGVPRRRAAVLCG
jgi:hypothetical protein